MSVQMYSLFNALERLLHHELTAYVDVETSIIVSAMFHSFDFCAFASWL